MRPGTYFRLPLLELLSVSLEDGQQVRRKKVTGARHILNLHLIFITTGLRYIACIYKTNLLLLSTFTTVSVSLLQIFHFWKHWGLPAQTNRTVHLLFYLPCFTEFERKGMITYFLYFGEKVTRTWTANYFCRHY